jgi:hypothetical protein
LLTGFSYVEKVLSAGPLWSFQGAGTAMSYLMLRRSTSWTLPSRASESGCDRVLLNPYASILDSIGVVSKVGLVDHSVLPSQLHVAR